MGVRSSRQEQSPRYFILVRGHASMVPSERLSCAVTKLCGWIWDTWYPIFGYDKVHQDVLGAQARNFVGQCMYLVTRIFGCILGIFRVLYDLLDSSLLHLGHIFIPYQRTLVSDKQNLGTPLAIAFLHEDFCIWEWLIFIGRRRKRIRLYSRLKWYNYRRINSGLSLTADYKPGPKSWKFPLSALLSRRNNTFST